MRQWRIETDSASAESTLHPCRPGAPKVRQARVLGGFVGGTSVPLAVTVQSQTEQSQGVVFSLYSVLTRNRGRTKIRANFIDKALRKQSTLDLGPPRERAPVKVPQDKPEEEPFQAQTQRRTPSRGGVNGGTLQPPGFDGSKGAPKSLTKK